ncbi:DUF1345 domain-containing protein [Nonomuraea lactucae]|uniref:DUF1345 domain-containing protein n=1 Tax=Nonomuraea lactucae TaxID=2249762 RepID=UPI000DE23724|nr:DUF1345 domain-containing protein [Nonomuraea lactucae]
MSVRRVLTSLGAGVVMAAGAWRLGVPELSPLLGWGVAATVGLVWVWLISWPKDHHDTKRLAKEEGDARSTDTGVLIGAVASLGAVALALVRTASHTLRAGDPPAYSDFAYLAFTIGVTFGVTDNRVVSTHIRKVALAHALLSYFFNTGILAVAINLVTGLGR